MSYGRILNLRCFIDPSEHSDAHAVYLAIDRVKETQLRLISAHANILDAWKIAVNGTAILESCSYSYKQTNNAITQAFISDLVETYGGYSSDDAEYQPCGNPKILIPWLMAGGSMSDKHIPDGISFEAIKPPLSKKWKIYCRKCNHPDYTHGMYAIGTSETEVLMFDREAVILTNAYIMAAYIADLLNNNNQSEIFLAKPEVDRLFADAQKVFSVELKTVELR